MYTLCSRNTCIKTRVVDVSAYLVRCVLIRVEISGLPVEGRLPVKRRQRGGALPAILRRLETSTSSFKRGENNRIKVSIIRHTTKDRPQVELFGFIVCFYNVLLVNSLMFFSIYLFN